MLTHGCFFLPHQARERATVVLCSFVYRLWRLLRAGAGLPAGLPRRFSWHGGAAALAHAVTGVDG